MTNKYRKRGKRVGNRKKTYLLEFEEGVKQQRIKQYMDYFYKNIKYGLDIIIVPPHVKVTVI